MYALAGLVVIALEAIIVFVGHPYKQNNAIIADVIVEPFLATLVTAFTYADVREDLSVRATWLRVLERSWAVLIIDLLLQLIGVLGLGSIAATDLIDKLLGVGVLIIAISFVFADVHATVVEDAEPWWLLVPRSLGVSMAVAWQGITFARALIVFGISVPFAQLFNALIQAAFNAQHLPAAFFWGNVLSTVLLLPPVQAFCTYVYLDAIGHEPESSASR